MGLPSLRISSQLSWLLPWGLYLLHAACYAGWVVDDAAISFAYSRSFATGAGWVAQPGTPPVEAFSNPLWVLLLDPCFWLEIFDPYLTTWLLAAMFIGGTFWLLSKCLHAAGLSRLEQALVLSLLAFNGPWVCWINCGLENPLYAFLVTALLGVSLQPSETESGRWGALLGLLAALPKLDGGDEPLVGIEGRPPSLRERPAGCAFHPRCPLAQERCRIEEPVLREVGATWSACHFAETLAGGDA